MNIEITKIQTDSSVEQCYVHARGLILPSGFAIITAQKLELSGCDVFYGLEIMKSNDGGKSFSKPVSCQHLTRRYYDDKSSEVMCDATPFYHQKTGKIILTGHTALYGADNKLLSAPRPRNTSYAVYNEKEGDFDPWHTLEMPSTENELYFSSGAGCTQILELPSGELLIPFYYKSYTRSCQPDACSTVAVMRCSFDGEHIKVLEIGNELTVDVPRGLGEPSIVKYGAEYFLAIRNDECGYVSRSDDGLHFEEPRSLCFDNGENLGNYNTQQHWLTGGGKLWLVYTRKAGNNDHIFRHRAPLFIGEFDPERMCVVRDTERIAVPERGARLGNFGCQSYSNDVGYVFASEWMQSLNGGAWNECAKYGSDNSIFISKITYL